MLFAADTVVSAAVGGLFCLLVQRRLNRSGKAQGKKRCKGLRNVEQVFEQYFPQHDNLKKASSDDSPLTSRFTVAENSGMRLSDGTCANDGRACLISLAKLLSNEEHREFLLSRIEDVAKDAEDSELYYLALADLRDELRLLEKTVSEVDGAGLERVSAAILDVICAGGCEVIEFNEWKPELQRVLRVESSLPVGSEPRVLSQVSSGIYYHGKLLRKQVVVLQKAKNNTIENVIE